MYTVIIFLIEIVNSFIGKYYFKYLSKLKNYLKLIMLFYLMSITEFYYVNNCKSVSHFNTNT